MPGEQRSGVTRLAYCLSRFQPSLLPFFANARRCVSSSRIFLPVLSNWSFRMRFSSSRYSMTSCCFRFIQPAIIERKIRACGLKTRICRLSEVAVNHYLHSTDRKSEGSRWQAVERNQRTKSSTQRPCRLYVIRSPPFATPSFGPFTIFPLFVIPLSSSSPPRRQHCRPHQLGCNLKAANVDTPVSPCR